jgi:ribose transport system permease protein
MSTTGFTAEEPPTATPSALAGAATNAMRGIARLQARYPIAQLLALIIIVVYGVASIPGYGSASSVKSMAVLAALLGLSALPQTLVVLIGHIDFSVPAFLTLGGVLTTVLAGGHGWPMYQVLLLIILACGVGGAISGFVCHRFMANGLIITLGMYSIVMGLILVTTKGNIVDTPPASLVTWTAVNGTTFGIAIPTVVVVWAAVAIVTGVVLSRTPAGRRLYATGMNLRAARMALLRTEVIWTVVFMLSAILAGLTGVLVSSYASGATPGMGDAYLFQGLTALIIGGTAIGNAHGDYWRTVLGSLILTALTTVLIGKGFDSTDTQILFGFMILVVVAGYGREQRIRDRV